MEFYLYHLSTNVVMPNRPGNVTVTIATPAASVREIIDELMETGRFYCAAIRLGRDPDSQDQVVSVRPYAFSDGGWSIITENGLRVDRKSLHDALRDFDWDEYDPETIDTDPSITEH